jgi:hypothetical protein
MQPLSNCVHRLLRGRPRLECLEDRTLLSGGSLDKGFGSGGQATTTFLSPLDAVPAASVLQPDNKIIVPAARVGSFSHWSSPWSGIHCRKVAG